MRESVAAMLLARRRWELVAVITFIIAGFGVLVVLAIVVGILDRAGAVDRRLRAAHRREVWEQRRRTMR